MQSLILKSVAKCRLYDLQEFFSVLVNVSQKHMPPLYPDLTAFTLWGLLCPQHRHRHTCPNDPARSRQTADTLAPLLPHSPLNLLKPSLPPSLPAQRLILELAAMLTLLASG